MKRFSQSFLTLALLLGLARTVDAAESNAVTETNVFIGTPRAMHHSRNHAAAEADSTNTAPAGNNAVANPVGAVSTNVPATSTASTDNTITGTDLTSFDIISRRNIFNPGRSGRRVRSTRSDRTAQVDSFTLVGTLSYTKGDFAIFDGTSASYRKNAKSSDTIAGYKVVGIYPDYVKLGAASNQFINLTVGSQMRRADGGPWKKIERADVTGNSYASSSSSGSSSISRSERSGGGERPPGNSDGNPPSGGESPASASSEPRASGRPPLPTSSEIQDEIKKKLMQKRESEQ